MTNKQIIYKNASVDYRVAGSGNAVMLVHGFGEDSAIWNAFAEQLTAHYTIIVPSLPGTPPSAIISEPLTGLEDYAACLHLILTKENIEVCCLVGHSMGGYTSLAFAEQYPAMLSGLCLFHSSAFADDEEKVKTRKKAIDFIKQKGSHAFLKTSTPGLFADAEKQEAAINALIDKGSAFPAAAVVQYYEAMINRPDRTDVLESIDVPVLFILGQQDKAVPLEQGLKQSHLAKKTFLTILRDSAHMGMLEESEKSFNTLADFLHSVYV